MLAEIQLYFITTINTPFPIARHTLQWLKAELFSWESCHTSITTRHTVIKTRLFSWESCLCAKSCKQCIQNKQKVFSSFRLISHRHNVLTQINADWLVVCRCICTTWSELPACASWDPSCLCHSSCCPCCAVWRDMVCTTVIGQMFLWGLS